jgi:hypothetical protein
VPAPTSFIGADHSCVCTVSAEPAAAVTVDATAALAGTSGRTRFHPTIRPDLHKPTPGGKMSSFAALLSRSRDFPRKNCWAPIFFGNRDLREPRESALRHLFDNVIHRAYDNAGQTDRSSFLENAARSARGDRACGGAGAADVQRTNPIFDLRRDRSPIATAARGMRSKNGQA